jgi:predicted alpha/beta hydrolase family esterase
MKNALVLHGTSSNSGSNWFPWLKRELVANGYVVEVPNLPEADNPNIDTYNEYLLNNYKFDENTVIIGHSSGAVEILGLLNDYRFPAIKLKACFLVGAFKGDLDWDALKGMVKDFDYAKIAAHSSKFVFIHSDDDPYCPIADAKDLCMKLHGSFVEFQGQGHFSFEANPKFDTFPDLLEIIQDEAV